ncbi:peptidylprolyl isomerase [Chryseosolibacter indicus]|uniref:peptidylprolyl isomerase n=1 Tax=Chryseosolibacter indicus TaxID=2782351 RepID=A0ABS5VRX8_9BACT|nr:peptidylprolyl isomerase [Chryseosolibacter indicus]MBT1704203.1 peptidylprolyl isomerase [Chryseosolibacter indicus]
MFKKFFPLLLLLSLVIACGKKSDGVNKFSDTEIKKIYDYKDKRLSDSLYRYFSQEDSTYRKEAVLAFGSIQDSAALHHIGKLLFNEPSTSVRKAAAFAIGQTPSKESERILLGAIMKEKNNVVLNELLEAYGKRTVKWELIQPTLLKDTNGNEGLSLSIYRAGLNGKTDTTANRIASILLSENLNESVRLIAAHYFARGAKDLGIYTKSISQSALNDRSAEVRMAAASALRKAKDPAVVKTLKEIIDSERDFRVKVNALYALRSFPIENTKSILYAALYNNNPNVGIAASEVIKAVATKDNWIELSNLTGRIENWRIKANLFEAAIKVSDNKSLIEEVKQSINQSINPYAQASLISSLQNSISAFDFIQEKLSADTAVVRTSAASALANLHQQKDFNQSLKAKYAEVCKEEMLKQKVDAAVIGILAEPLADSLNNYRSTVKDFSFLAEGAKKLSLPKDNEALQPVEKAIAYFERRKAKPVVNEFNHPIDWDFIKNIKNNQEAIVKTTKGNVRIQLLTDEAPGSVANFVKLAQSNYFDGKPFHRVVPNFVIQGGCNRGDGWGSEDYSIRSEFTTRKYKTGSVGMASAGKDTEGTQWFITHSPTPHLDGRYTIFAEVVEGMDLVHRIEVGDVITDVEIAKSK